MQRIWFYRFTIGFILIIVLLGVYARASGILKGYFAFTFDQGRDFLVFAETVQNQDLRFIGPPTGIDGVFHGVWWHWFMLPIFWVSSGNPTLVILAFSFVVTSILFITAWYFGRYLHTRLSALVMTGLVSTSLFFVGTASQFWHPNVVPVLTLQLAFATYYYLRTKKYFFLIPLLLGLIIEFEVGFGLLFIPAFFVTLVITRSFPPPKTILVSSLGFLFWLLPRILFDLRNNFLQIKSLVTYIEKGGDQPSNSLMVRIAERLVTLFNVFKDTFGGRNELVALIVVICLVGFFVWVIHNRPHYRAFFTFQLVVIFLTILISSFYTKPLWDYYLIGIPSLIVPLVTLSLTFLIQKNRLIGWIITIFLLIINLQPWQWFIPDWAGDASVYRNQFDIVKTIYADAQNQPFNVQVYSPSVIDYTYNYLFFWYGKTYRGYTPNRESSEKLVYLIVEPEPWNPKLLEAWLRDREGDGTIVWERQFRGGIEVEKRQRK